MSIVRLIEDFRYRMVLEYACRDLSYSQYENEVLNPVSQDCFELINYLFNQEINLLEINRNISESAFDTLPDDYETGDY
jgi:hypothetical protein